MWWANYLPKRKSIEAYERDEVIQKSNLGDDALDVVVEVQGENFYFILFYWLNFVLS